MVINSSDKVCNVLDAANYYRLGQVTEHAWRTPDSQLISVNTWVLGLYAREVCKYKILIIVLE